MSFYAIEQGEVEVLRRDPTGNSTSWRGLGRESFLEKLRFLRYGPHRERPRPHHG